MAMQQMNTRIPSSIKRRGDAVLRRYGYSPSSAVQALWKYVAERGTIPGFMETQTTDEGRAELREKIEGSRGLGIRLFEDMAGYRLGDGSSSAMTDDELREAEWRERGELA